jgi:small subunit ribosomal protein S1
MTEEVVEAQEIAPEETPANEPEVAASPEASAAGEMVADDEDIAAGEPAGADEDVAADEAAGADETAGEATTVQPQSLADLKPKMKVKGRVQRLELYGAILDLGVGVPAILHVSQIAKDRVNRVGDVLKVGDEVEVWVDKVDADRNQVTVSMIQPLAVDWSDLKEGQVHTGTVTRLEKFGAFVDIGAEKEGLVHISELSHDFVKQPSEVVSPGAEVQVKVLGFSKRKRRIDLSMKALLDAPSGAAPNQPQPADTYADEYEEQEELPTAMALALQQAMSDAGMKYDRRRQPQIKKGRGGRRNRSQQEDILSRTLRINEQTGK